MATEGTGYLSEKRARAAMIAHSPVPKETQPSRVEGWPLWGANMMHQQLTLQQAAELAALSASTPPWQLQEMSSRLHTMLTSHNGGYLGGADGERRTGDGGVSVSALNGPTDSREVTHSSRLSRGGGRQDGFEQVGAARAEIAQVGLGSFRAVQNPGNNGFGAGGLNWLQQSGGVAGAGAGAGYLAGNREMGTSHRDMPPF